MTMFAVPLRIDYDRWIAVRPRPVHRGGRLTMFSNLLTLYHSLDIIWIVTPSISCFIIF